MSVAGRFIIFASVAWEYLNERPGEGVGEVGKLFVSSL